MRDHKNRRWYKHLERVAVKEIEKASNKCLPDEVLTETAKMQAYEKGINYAVSKASKHIHSDLNKSSLERSYLEAVLI